MYFLIKYLLLYNEIIYALISIYRIVQKLEVKKRLTSINFYNLIYF